MPPGKPRRGDWGVALRPAPKGRDVDVRALADVRALLGDEPRRADLLIEHLHRIQDARGYLSAAHLTALAHELGMTPAEIFEVATFYHHFDVVKAGAAPPPPLTVRVCESIACELAGSRELLESLRSRLGPAIRVLAAPCVGRCDSAPVAVVGRNPVGRASVETVEETALAGRTEDEPPTYSDYRTYRASGGYAILASCVDGS